MNGFEPPDDADTCGCTYGQACVYHRRLREEAQRALDAQMYAEGWVPEANIDGLEELLFALEACRALSDVKKKQIRQIIFRRGI